MTFRLIILSHTAYHLHQNPYALPFQIASKLCSGELVAFIDENVPRVSKIRDSVD